MMSAAGNGIGAKNKKKGRSKEVRLECAVTRARQNGDHVNDRRPSRLEEHWSMIIGILTGDCRIGLPHVSLICHRIPGVKAINFNFALLTV